MRRPLIEIDSTAFDRDPVLGRHERQALRALSSGKQIRDEHARDLRRLIEPLATIVDFADPSRVNRSQVIRPVLLEMANGDDSYWVWPRERWMRACTVDLRIGGRCQPYVAAAAYLYSAIPEAWRLYRTRCIVQREFARKIFGTLPLESARDAIIGALRSLGYSKTEDTFRYAERALYELCLYARTAKLEELLPEHVETMRRGNGSDCNKRATFAVSQALTALGHFQTPATKYGHNFKSYREFDATDGVPAQWAEFAMRWRAHCTLSKTTVSRLFSDILRVGRWFATEGPHLADPAAWRREDCARWIATIMEMRVGDYLSETGYRRRPKNAGKPLCPGTRASMISAIRAFFRDAQENEWIPRRFDPAIALAYPRSLQGLLGPNPRLIEDDVWAKLMWAGLTLEPTDIPDVVLDAHYPFELIRALALVWLFSGLRSNEICRLRVGCVRWLAVPEEVDLIAGTSRPEQTVCLLDVPTNKTNTAFTKPVDAVVGEAIERWERTRLGQPSTIDKKTGERVHKLFWHRGQGIGNYAINAMVIPYLCKRAGIPEGDARGRITSHRGRATIATQLYTAKQPMTFFDLQQWLGHRSPRSTEYYVKLTPTQLAQSYNDASYFRRNLRTISVLLDRQALADGAATSGQPYLYYDLGHGYCTHDFFSTCPHRMACARCSFYLPKDSSRAQLVEASDNNLRFSTEIALTDAEREAISGDAAAVEVLLAKIQDQPTLEGITPKQIRSKRDKEPRTAV